MSKIKTDAEFCGKVPLHQTNLIQPHGVLLIIGRQENLPILQASENVEAIFKQPVEDFVGTGLSMHLTKDSIRNFLSLTSQRFEGRIPYVFQLPGSSFLSTIKWHESYFTVELDNIKRDELSDRSFLSIYQEIKYVMAAIDGASTTEDTCAIVARDLKRLSGFDKVMVYQFDEEWNGDVVAEDMEEGMESYMGLKFPASDIPAQARALYKQIPYRLIPTADYKPVKLYPVINPVTNAFTDLSDSNLRSVAAVHLEYLRNMKVNASMSTRILKDGELWGLIACHHRTPKYLSFEMCAVFELLSSVITTKISAVQKADELAYAAAIQKEMTALLDDLYSGGNIDSGMDYLQTLLEADGICMNFDHRFSAIGITPGRHDVEDLVTWLQSNDIKGVYHQPSLASVYEPAEAYAQIGSGLLALAIEPSKGGYILAFRAEVQQQVQWSGNPAEAIRFESDGVKYHPRASFKMWQEKLKMTSLPWKRTTLQTAEVIRNMITSFRLNHKSV